MVRIEELTQTWSGLSAGSGDLRDGFHLLSWTEVDVHTLTPEWNALARSAASPNPFFEPWFLLPALRRFDADGAIDLALMFDDGRLVALMPVWCDPSYHGRRLPHLSAWVHPNSFCGVPLIEPGFEENFWNAYIAAADARAGRALFLQVPQLPVESSAYGALVTVCERSGRPSWMVHREHRAVLRRGLPSDAFAVAALSAKKRKELRRQRKRLDELGEVTIERARDEAGLEEWIDRFLLLEARGWKGSRGSALASDPRTAALFREALAGAAEARLLERLDLSLGGEPIAMLVNFLTAPGGFAFKTTFDESFARYSPGVLLQLENLALLDDPHIDWCDSCAAADHPMIERIWRDRREIAWVNVAIGGAVRRATGGFLSAIEARRAKKRA